MPSLKHLPKSAPQEDIWAAIDEDGGLIVENFMDTDLLARLRDDAMPLVSRHGAGVRDGDDFWKEFHGENTKRITGLAGKSTAWCDLLCDPLYRAMGDHYLGADNYYLNTGQLICIGPKETPQILHRDELNWPEATAQDHEITITAIFALTDFTEENGATVIAPGSHKWPGAMPEVPEGSTCQAVMKAGDALLYSGKVIHGGGENKSDDQWRVGLHAGFVLGWLRAEENHQLTTTLDEARTMPKHVQAMLGFRSYVPPAAGRLGLVDYEDAGLLLDG